jgi:hypothetical protein|tara:strand:- start:760 stop:1179 length:420 start_codon:yes stop_codon:yes gene_type:complete
MNINKLIIFILTLVLLNFNYVWSDEKIKLDEEELPAIDPFQGNAAVGQNQNSIDENSSEQNSEAGILNGMRLVGTIIGKSKKFAILSRPDGNVFKFEEDQKLNSNVSVVEIFRSYVIVEDENSKFYQVYMNNLIQEIDG